MSQNAPKRPADKRPSEPTREGLICLGQVKAAQGLNGEVRVASFTEVAEDIATYGALCDKQETRKFVISKCRAAKNHLVVKFEGIDDRNAADLLKGTELFVDRAQLGDMPDDETWFYADLIGLEAVLKDGQVFGIVTNVQNFGAGDLLDIALAGTQKSIFMPFTRDTAPKIDIAASQIVIAPPPGLLDNEAEE